MDLQLKNVNVAPGETVEGTASLTMKKEVMGKEVAAILYAQKTVRRRTTPKGGVSTIQLLIYSKSQTLDTEKLYTTANSPYQYKFAFVIPETSASGLQGGTIVRWYVAVELKHEAALKFPVAKTQEINIVAKGDVVATTESMESIPPETAPPGEMRFCSQCGTQLHSGAAFCSNCGAKQ